eukprot:g2435.t1
MADIASWGINVVRLGVMWPGVEPVEGQYNATYLGVVKGLVDDLWINHGVRTIVDFHQDVIARKWCGEGVPGWLVPKYLEPVTTTCSSGVVPWVGKLIGQCASFASFNFTDDPATGYPTTKDCLSLPFDRYSRAPDVTSAWQHFYDSPAVQGAFEGFWRQVVGALRDSDGVLGYELINEPLPGDFFANPDLLLPGHGDLQHLQPMYQRLCATIRGVDPDAICFFEPTPFPDTFPANIPLEGGVHAAGFTAGPAPDDPTHQALSYHIYTCGFASSSCGRNGDPPSYHDPTADSFASSAVRTRTADRDRLGKGGGRGGGGIFITEFGACSGAANCLGEIERVTSRADAALQSWAYWQFKYNDDLTTVSGPIEGVYDTDGKLQVDKVAALSRTYAPVIAGTPTVMRFDPATAAFRLQYTTLDAAEKMTEAEAAEAAAAAAAAAVGTEAAALNTSIFMNVPTYYNATTGGFLVHVLNGTASNRSSTSGGGGGGGSGGSVAGLDVVADPGATVVDVVVMRPFRGATSGTFASKDGDRIDWTIADAAPAAMTANGTGAGAGAATSSSPPGGFVLKTASGITWWKSLQVFGDSRSGASPELFCTMETQDSNHGPVNCEIGGARQHDLLFDYTIAVSKAKALGVHEQVDTIPGSYFGPLLGKVVTFTWVKD